ncbi:hypothetical protein KC19_9G162000 [Ceratodon purpureus]|uniref:RIN4 pathogenic type III effector avirulence factor Avr cleavage site domain-containing protein n=1 Tax=Ceratodon purpureus TaxID=3225 RepID=A0A8T0H0G9_CERPU|nr:hypothetical protein KC19_9G162000 [Ceratodon purpureus]
MAPEASFVLKRGEGLHNTNMIKHKVVYIETPRTSSVGSTPKMIPLVGSDSTRPVKSSYVSPMQRAREERKRREAGQSKDWDETSSSPSSEMSTISNGGTPPSKPARVIPHSGGLIPKSGGLIPKSGNLIPSSGNLIPSSGYIAKPRDSVSEEDGASRRLPKFGVWDNQNDASGPCYTLLFESVAQEKRIGGPIRVHANRPSSPAQSEDLYNYNPGAIKTRKSKLQLHHSLLCCFVGS